MDMPFYLGEDNKFTLINHIIDTKKNNKGVFYYGLSSKTFFMSI